MKWSSPCQDESWHDFLFSQLSCHLLWWSMLKASPCGTKYSRDKREHSLLTLQESRHCPLRRFVFSDSQKPFLIWPALGWHIPEPKCTHKRLSLVAKLFHSWMTLIRGSWAFSIGLRWQGKRSVIYYFNTIWLQKCLSRPFCLRAYFTHSRGSPA